MGLPLRVACLWLCTGLWMMAAPVARAEPLTLDAENVYKLSLVMLEQGRPDKALSFSKALLQRDPDDSRALALKSWAERDLGFYDDAVASGRLAWAKSTTKGDSYGAAMAVAQAMSSRGQKFRAQFWLRRAIEVAPDEMAKQVAVRDFGYVRSRSRLWLRFDAQIRPSDNVNNGSSSDILWFYGLPLELSGDAQALSGTDASIGVSLKYRLAETDAAKTDLVVSAVHKAVVLSDKAKAQAPMARGSDYAYSALEFGLERAWRPKGMVKGSEALAAITYGHSWYAGDPMSDYLRLQLGVSRPVSPKLVLRGNLAVERQERLDSPLASADLATLGFGIGTVTGKGDRLDLGISLRDTRSDSPEIDHSRVRVDLDWTRRAPVLGAQLSLGVWTEAREYANSRYSVDGRSDQSLGADLSLAFEDIDYMGFIPVVTVTGATTRSNIDLYDSQTMGVGFTIRSKF